MNNPMPFQHVWFTDNEQLAGIAMDTLNLYWPNVLFESVETGRGGYELKARPVSTKPISDRQIQEFGFQVNTLGYALQVVNKYYTLK